MNKIDAELFVRIGLTSIKLLLRHFEEPININIYGSLHVYHAVGEDGLKITCWTDTFCKDNFLYNVTRNIQIIYLRRITTVNYNTIT